jgi:hypothetical protein
VARAIEAGASFWDDLPLTRNHVASLNVLYYSRIAACALIRAFQDALKSPIRGRVIVTDVTRCRPPSTANAGTCAGHRSRLSRAISGVASRHVG